MGTDVFGWYQMSAQGGHAGPDSSAVYTHQIEHACALVSQNARPQAWLPAPLEGVTMTSFEDIGNLNKRPLQVGVLHFGPNLAQNWPIKFAGPPGFDSSTALARYPPMKSTPNPA
jgi:hypothetical protein